MNRIYKSIWNAITHSWTAVSEWQSAKGKKSGKVLKSLFISTLILSAVSSPTYANTYGPGSYETLVLNGFYIGNSAWKLEQPLDEDSTWFGTLPLNNEIVIDFSNIQNTRFEDIGSSEGLLKLASEGYRQVVFTTSEITDYGYANSMFDTSATKNIRSDLYQNSERVATLNYAVGNEAFGLFVNNTEVLKGYVIDEGNFLNPGDKIRFGDFPSLAFQEDGVAWTKDTPITDGIHGLYLLTLLTGIELTNTSEGKGLNLTANNQSLSVTPVISGRGNIIYSGSGSFNIEKLLVAKANGDPFTSEDAKNTYEGNTYILGTGNAQSLQINLNKEQALGLTKILDVSNATLNVNNKGETVNGNANFNNAKLVLHNADYSSNSRLNVLGNATFGENAIIESTADAQNTDTGLVVSGLLSISSDNSSSLEGAVMAGSAFLKNVNALGDADLVIKNIANNDQADGEVIIDLSGGTHIFDSEIRKNNTTSDQIHMRISNRSTDSQNTLNLTYDPNATIEADDTTINSNVNLTVTGIEQLGSKVTFDETTDLSSKLEILKKGTSTTWTLDNNIQFVSSNTNDIVEVNGSGFSLNDSKILENYSGWLRLSNTEFDLTSDAATVLGDKAGLSLGANSTFNLTGNETVELNRLGWTSDIESGEKGGVLDLTQFEFSKDNPSPALRVGLLDMRGRSTIELDREKSNIFDAKDPNTSLPYLDADSGENLVYQIIAAEEVIGSSYTIPEWDDDREFDIDGKSTQIATATWGYNLDAVLEGDDKGLWLAYNLKSITLKNSQVSDDNYDDYLILDLKEAKDNEFSAKLSGQGKVLVTNSGDSSKTQFRISESSNDFAGRIVIDDGITVSSAVGALGKEVSDGYEGVIVELEQNSDLTIESVEPDATNKTQYLADIQMSADSDHTITIGDNSVLALQLADIPDHQHSWANVGFEGNGTLRLVQGSLEIQNAADAVHADKFAGRIQVDEKATLNLVDDNTDSYVFNYLMGNGTVGVGLNAVVGSSVAFVGDYVIQDGKNLTINADSATAINQSDLILEEGATLNYQNIQNGNKFGYSLTVNGESKVVFDNSSGTYITVTGAQHLLHIEALNSSDIVFDWSAVNRSTLYSQTIQNDSKLTYQFAGGQDQFAVDFTKTSGEGELWLDFADQVKDLQLTKSTSYSGTLGFRNATVKVGSDSGFNFGNQIDFGLAVGEGSTLVNKGQTTLSKGLVLRQSATLDFTTDSSSFNQSGLSSNAIIMGNGAGIDVNGPTNVLFDLTNIDVSIDQDFTADSLLDALSKSTSTVLTVIDNVKLKDGQTADNLAGNFVLNPGEEQEKWLDIVQDGEIVAQVMTGLDVIGTDNGDGTASLGIGGAATTLSIIDGKVLDIDVTDTKETDPVINTDIVGNGSIRFIQGSADDRVDVTVNSSNSNYSGSTVITDGAHVRGANSNAFGRYSSLLQVGTAEVEDGLTSNVGELTLESTSGNLDQRVQQLVVEKDGVVNMKANAGYAHIHVVAQSQDQESIIKGKLRGDQNSVLWTEGNTVLSIAQDADLSEFKGSFTGQGSSVIRYHFNDGEEFAFNSNFYDQSVVAFTGTGTVNIVNDSNGMLSARSESGTLTFADRDMKLNRLETSSQGKVDLNGLLTVNDFKADGGVLAMDVALGSSGDEKISLAANDNDGLLVKGIATGSVGVLINDKNKLEKGKEESLTLIQVDGDASDFTAYLVDDNGMTLPAITAGGYDYVLLAQDQNVQTTQKNVATGTDYVLSSIAGDEEIRNTTVSAGAYIGIAYAAQLFDLSLHDRVGNRDWINPVTGEKQTTSLWMHHTMSHERFRDSTSQLRMRTTSNTTMLGGDFVQFTTGNTGLAYAGLMGGYGTMDTKSHSKMTNLHSKAETDAWGVGAYAGWKADSDGQTGPYVDGWLMFTHASSDVTGVDRNTEDVKGEGLSASIEAGWGFKVGSAVMDNGKVANLTVEPHASVTWFGMQYDEIHNDVQDVKFEGTNNVRTRLGARAIVTEEGNKDFNAFVEANWVHNTQEYGATISGLRVDQAGSRNLGEARIGLDWHVTDSLSVWGRVGASYGSDAYSEREGSIGVRYQF